MMMAWMKVVTIEMERSSQIQKFTTNSFADVGYETKSDVKDDAKFFDLSN